MPLRTHIPGSGWVVPALDLHARCTVAVRLSAARTAMLLAICLRVALISCAINWYAITIDKRQSARLLIPHSVCVENDWQNPSQNMISQCSTNEYDWQKPEGLIDSQFEIVASCQMTLSAPWPYRSVGCQVRELSSTMISCLGCATRRAERGVHT
jgi:hypothetical protein